MSIKGLDLWLTGEDVPADYKLYRFAPAAGITPRCTYIFESNGEYQHCVLSYNKVGAYFETREDRPYRHAFYAFPTSSSLTRLSNLAKSLPELRY